MDLADYREQIDKIDDELLRVFKERMDVSRGIAIFKKENSLPVMDAAREREKLATICDKVGEELYPYAVDLFEILFELSRESQGSFMDE